MQNRSVSVLLAVGVGVGVSCGASSPARAQGAFAEEIDRLSATVTAMEPATRLITLRTSDGREITIEASDEVRNFDQIEVGDDVTATFYTAVAADITQAQPSADDEPFVVESARSPIGDRPAGAEGLVYTVIVTVDAVDTAANRVTFTGPGGRQREAAVERPEMQQFLTKLKPGDRVQVTYTEATAIAVLPAGNAEH